MTDSPPTNTVAFDQRLHKALAEALRHAVVPGWVTAGDDDGSPFPFVDLMSDPGTDIGTGEERIKDFAEAVAEQVLELLDGEQPDEPSEQYEVRGYEYKHHSSWPGHQHVWTQDEFYNGQHAIESRALYVRKQPETKDAK